MNEHMQLIVKEETAEHVYQLKDISDPETAECHRANVHRQAGRRYFIDDRLPSGKYNLLRIPFVNCSFAKMTCAKDMFDMK